jgi:prepilin-type N-terminal cleavage/methylation domain-containing protein
MKSNYQLSPTLKTNSTLYRFNLRGNDTNLGFTLVELSIVLMIIGLLVSGILVGKDMIRAAEMRSIITEKDEVQTAVMLFKNKYLGLPGDLSNATDFWGTMPTGTCSNTVAGASGGTGTQTCNGNGDGMINGAELNSNANAEAVLFWQHLSNAKMIKGTYSGIWTNWADTKTYYSSKMMTAYWYVDSFTGATSIDLVLFEGDYGNSLFHRGPSDNNPDSEEDKSFVLTPMEAWNIDKKIDDGLPGVGKVNTLERDGANCNTLAASATNPAASYSYNLGYKGIACSLNFKNMF